MVKTMFDRFFDEKMRDPKWASGYRRARARIDLAERKLLAVDKEMSSTKPVEGRGPSGGSHATNRSPKSQI
jgi:hypothetical protein